MKYKSIAIFSLFIFSFCYQKKHNFEVYSTEIKSDKIKDSISNIEHFDIYFIYDRFNIDLQEFFKSKNYKSYSILADNAIVSNDKNKIDTNRILDFINKKFPSKDSSYICVLDWEKNIHWHNLKKVKINENEYLEALDEYIKLAKYVKSVRPNCKVGFFGIPYRFSNEKMRRFNEPKGKFNQLLSEVDFIAPSLYIEFTDSEIGHENNLIYLEENLKEALYYSKILNKPIIPFFWHRIHPKNEKHGLEVISDTLMTRYIKKIISFDKEYVKGIFWWSPHKEIDKKLNDRQLKSNEINNLDRNKLVKSYLKTFENNINEINVNEKIDNKK